MIYRKTPIGLKSREDFIGICNCKFQWIDLDFQEKLALGVYDISIH